MAADRDAAGGEYERWIFLCNRCNHSRPGGQHPCPVCRCPEFRLAPAPAAALTGAEVPAEVAAASAARTGEPYCLGHNGACWGVWRWDAKGWDGWRVLATIQPGELAVSVVKRIAPVAIYGVRPPAGVPRVDPRMPTESPTRPVAASAAAGSIEQTFSADDRSAGLVVGSTKQATFGWGD